VCTGCGRWNPVPLEDRWEALGALEEAFQSRGVPILASDELALARVDGGELVRVGEPPRESWAGWRYGTDLPRPDTPRPGLLRRFLERLPAPPVEGYDPYGLARLPHSERWFASPFIESAGPLTALFRAVPLAPRCPGCGEPLLLKPWDFQRLRFEKSDGEVRVAAPCALCGREVLIPLGAARPAIRLGLATVTRDPALRRRARPVARRVEAWGGAREFLEGMAARRLSLGELGPGLRMGLGMVLDEGAESDALEREWRTAEEVAELLEGDLSAHPGFEAFQRRVQGGE
jgi:hypothetical protein